MKLLDFKTLVDKSSEPPAPPAGTRSPSEACVLTEIRGFITARDSDRALADVRSIIADLGLRFLCDGSPCDTYLGVAEALLYALRERGHCQASTSDWPKAIEISRRHLTLFGRALPIDQKWRTDVRVSSISTAINELRQRGYAVQLPAEGGISVPHDVEDRMIRDLEGLAASLGRDLAISAAAAMEGSWSTLTERFNIGRSGQTAIIDAKPQRTLAYMYQLGLRYFHLPSTAESPQDALNQLMNLATYAVALMDLTSEVPDLLFARPNDVLQILRSSVVYDAVFLLAQAKTSHARKYVEWMMHHVSFAGLVDAKGRTAAQVLSVAGMLFDHCGKSLAIDFSVVEPRWAAYAANLDIDEASGLLRDVFCHDGGANKKLSLPPMDTKIDAAFRPLVPLDGNVVMQPPAMAARAIVNAVMDWCRKAWPTKRFDDEALGPMFEQFVRHVLAEKGITVLHGTYGQGVSSSECDAVIETDDAVIFFELKSKVLRREGRTGNDLVALADLGQAVVRPQAQAMTRHAALKRDGSMTLTSGAGKVTIDLGAREVLKVSVTRGELASLHDRPFLQRFLHAGCLASFDANDPQNQGDLKDLNAWFTKLRLAAHQVGRDEMSGLQPFGRSWSLSIFQLLLLLERSTSNESFAFELQRTRRIVMQLRDFYAEYEFALQRLRKEPTHRETPAVGPTPKLAAAPATDAGASPRA